MSVFPGCRLQPCRVPALPGWGHGPGGFPECPRAPLGRQPQSQLGTACVPGRGDTGSSFPWAAPDASLSTDRQSRCCGAQPQPESGVGPAPEPAGESGPGAQGRGRRWGLALEGSRLLRRSGSVPCPSARASCRGSAPHMKGLLGARAVPWHPRQ